MATYIILAAVVLVLLAALRLGLVLRRETTGWQRRQERRNGV